MAKHVSRILRRPLSLLLTLVLAVSLFPAAALAGDYSGHWAQTSIDRAVELGWFVDENATRPNDPITRAEFVTIVNRMKGYTGSSDLSGYPDVNENDWHYGAFAAAVANGYIKGSDGMLLPNKSISRNEAVTILARISGLDTSGGFTAALSNVKDTDNIPEWARPYVGAAVSNGLIAGFDGKFSGGLNITRAETSVLLERLYDDIRTYGFAGTYTGSADSAVIMAAGITLKNMDFTGDLTIDESVGSGEVTLDNVNVGGKLFVNGGGSDSVYIRGGSIAQIVVNKDTVRVVMSDGSAVEHMSVGASAPSIILGAGVIIETITVVSGAEGTTIFTLNNSGIGTVNIDAAGTSITGSGSIATANIKADNVLITQKPAKTNVDSGISANVGGVIVTGTTTPPPGGGIPAVRVESVSLDASELTLQIGQTFKLTGTVLPGNAANKAIIWTSSDETVAKVIGGTITPKSVGRTVIAAKTSDGGFTALVDVTVTAAIIDSNTVPLSTYDGDVIIRVGSEDIDLVDVKFNGNVTIEEDETIATPAIEPLTMLLGFDSLSQEAPVITPYLSTGKVNFKGSTRIAGEGKSLEVNAETEITAGTDTVIGRITAKKNAALDLSGSIDKINVGGSVTLSKLTVSGGANPEVTGGGEVLDVEVKGGAGNNTVGLTITAKVGKINLASGTAGDTIGTINIGGNNTNTEVNIKNVTVGRVVIADTAAPVILVDTDSIIETVTALSNSTKNQTRIEGEGAVNKLQKTALSDPDGETLDTISIAVTGGSGTTEETIEPVLTSIVLASAPSKADYLVDDDFDPSGISVVGRFQLEDGGTVSREFKSYTIAAEPFTTVGSKTVTVMAADDESVKTSFSVTVRADKTALSAAITAAKAAAAVVAVSSDGLDINPGKNWVTPAEKTAVNTAIAAAETVNGKPGAAKIEVDSAASTLNSAVTVFNGLKKDGQKPGAADKAPLTSVITAARSAAESTVTSSVGGRDLAPGMNWVSPAKKKALTDAIAAASIVFNDNESTQDTIDTAVSALTAALGTFTASVQESSTNKAALNLAISEAIGAKENIKIDDAGGGDSTASDSWVTTEAMTALNTTIAAAQKVSGNDKASQIEIDNAAAELEKAASIFKNQITSSVIDTTPLSAAIADANTAKSGAAVSEDGTDVETSQTWVPQSAVTALENAITAAEGVLSGGGLTQNAVSAAAAILKAATAVFNNSKQYGSYVKPTVTDVSVSPSSATIAVSETQQLTATVTGTNNPAQTVTWSSSNTSYATVSPEGLVTAIAPGTVTITAESTVDGTKSGTATITVAAQAKKVTSGGIETYYAELAEALSDAAAIGDEVTLLSDAELTTDAAVDSNAALIIPADTTLTVKSALTVSGTMTVSGTLQIIMSTGSVSGVYTGAAEWHAASAWELKSALDASKAGDTIMITAQIGEDVKDTSVLHKDINAGSGNDAGYYNFRVTKAVTIKSDEDNTIYGNFTLGQNNGSPVEGAEFIGLTIVTPRLRFSGNPGSSKVFLYAIGGVTNDVTITDCSISTSQTVYSGASGYGYDCVYRGISLVPTAATAAGIDYNITGTNISFNQTPVDGAAENPIVSGLSGIAVMSSKYGNEGSNWSGRYPGVANPGTFGAQSDEDALSIYDELALLTGNTTGTDFPRGVDIAVWYGASSEPGASVVTPGSRASYDS